MKNLISKRIVLLGFFAVLFALSISRGQNCSTTVPLLYIGPDLVEPTCRLQGYAEFLTSTCQISLDVIRVPSSCDNELATWKSGVNVGGCNADPFDCQFDQVVFTGTADFAGKLTIYQNPFNWTTHSWWDGIGCSFIGITCDEEEAFDCCEDIPIYALPTSQEAPPFDGT